MVPAIRLFTGPVFHLDTRSAVTCEALAVSEGRVIAFGSYPELKYKFPTAAVQHIGSGHAYPGFADAHGHLTRLGRMLSEVNLSACRSWQEVLELVKQYAAGHPHGWILGRGWNNELWLDRAFPTRTTLDQLFPDRPVLLERIDIHTALVNGVALDLSGLSTVKDIPGGKVAWENNQPTGLLFDHAIDRVWTQVPPPTQTDTARHLMLAQEKLFAHGIVSVGDALLPDSEIAVIRSLKAAGRFPLRVYGMLPADAHHLDNWLPQGPVMQKGLTVRAFKVFTDGTFGSRTAWLRDPYHDQPDTKGISIWDTEALLDVAKRVYQAGFQLCAHAIGDAALDQVLDVYAQVLKGDRTSRWRVEHVQLADEKQLDKFEQLGLVASLQPQHSFSDADWINNRLGGSRIPNAYPLKSLLARAAGFALGSDFPVEPPDALSGMAAAIFRKKPLGAGESISAQDALCGYTQGVAFAEFDEQHRGKLLPGYVADITVVSHDLFEKATWEASKVALIATVADGEIVFPDSML